MPQPDGGPGHARLATRPSTLTVTEIAWVVLIPWATVAVVAIVLLGSPVGSLLFTHTSDALWPSTWWQAIGHPEPTKHGRYLVAVVVPLLLAGAILVAARRPPALPALMTRALVLAAHALVLALVAVALLEQHPTFTAPEEPIQEPTPPIFGLWKVLVSAALVLGLATLLRRGARCPRIARPARETRSIRGIVLAIAAGFIAIWVLKAVTTDGLALGAVSLNFPWSLTDAAAVLDGRTPFVDLDPIYAKLLPYLCVPVLSAFGANALSYSIFMALLAGLALLAVYSVFRRVTRGAVLALVLLIPFVATSDISLPIAQGLEAGQETSPMMLAALWPMRYGGAYLLAWLTVRHIDGCRPRRIWILFFAGGLVAIDNLEFGAAAVAATAAALLCARPPSSARDVLRLAGNLAGGLSGAFAIVTLITLARSGLLPDFSLLLEWPRIFATLGWLSMPLRTWELHLAVYATYVAAIAVAAVRVARRDEDVVLTAMLAWSGVFGLLASGYLVGRPDAQKLTGVLSAWSFALSMLVIVCVRTLAARRWRATAPQLLTLFGFGLSLCSLATTSLPQKQIARLRGPPVDASYLPTAKQFIGERTRPGEKVVVLVPMSYVITHELRLRNVSPYVFVNEMITRSQMTRLLATLRRERVQAVFIPAVHGFLLNEGDSTYEHLRLLEAVGYPVRSTGAGIVELRAS
jgi:hypothetical protein